MKFRTHVGLYRSFRDDTFESFIEGLSVREKVELSKAKTEIYPLPKSPDQDRIRNMAEKYNLYTNILHMKFGQFIMLETELRSDNASDEVIASLIIRPKDEKHYDNEDQEREERIIESIMDEDLLDVHSVTTAMLLNRDFVLFTKFSGVLYNKVEPNTEEEEEEEDKKDGKIGDDEFQQQWFWYRIVRELSQGDIRRYNDIYDLSMSVVMVELAFLSQKAILDNARARAEEARQRAMYRR